ncbi:hypothetical protein ACFFSH_16840 [Streptomyces filamentosus]|uniref:Uncharacterized protein n=1 Tax=Streptomyces filamentosus TaxID=67294 RepID=A0A919BS46_STRFL|nr:hypothetical protein GCM10017667_43190 [Streptomyces filamentosus]
MCAALRRAPWDVGGVSVEAQVGEPLFEVADVVLGPGSMRARLHERGELGGRPADAAGQAAGVLVPTRAPVRGGREYRGGHDDGTEMGETARGAAL